MLISTLFVVDFIALLTCLKVIIKLIRFFTVSTKFVIEFLKCTFETEFIIFSDFSSVIEFFNELFFIHFPVLFFQCLASTLVSITRTTFNSTISTNLMPITLFYTAIVLHTLMTIKFSVAVPIMIVTKVRINSTLVSLYYFLSLK